MSKIQTVSPSRSSRSERWGVGLFIGAILLAVFIPPAGWASFPDICLFHRMTGLPCPTCGMTRAWAALLRGQFRMSFRLHAFGGISLVVFAWVLGFRLKMGRWPRPPRAFVISGMVLWAAYGVGRMLGLVPGP